LRGRPREQPHGSQASILTAAGHSPDDLDLIFFAEAQAGGGG
jgi:hypothetical protein